MTPPSARSRHTRQRLLEASGEVFAEGGFRGAAPGKADVPGKFKTTRRRYRWRFR